MSCIERGAALRLFVAAVLFLMFAATIGRWKSR